MSIIVAGGAGFIGLNLTNELLKRKKKIIILDNFSKGKKIFFSRIKNNRTN